MNRAVRRLEIKDEPFEDTWYKAPDGTVKNAIKLEDFCMDSKP